MTAATRWLASLLTLGIVSVVVAMTVLAGEGDRGLVLILFGTVTLGVVKMMWVGLRPTPIQGGMSEKLFDQVLAQGYLDVEGLPADRALLAVHDALDSVRSTRGSKGMLTAGRIAAGVGAGGWLAWGVGALVVAGDGASSAIALAASAAFAALWGYVVRGTRKLQRVEDVLEEQRGVLEEEGGGGQAGVLAGDWT